MWASPTLWIMWNPSTKENQFYVAEKTWNVSLHFEYFVSAAFMASARLAELPVSCPFLQLSCTGFKQSIESPWTHQYPALLLILSSDTE